MPIGQFSMQGGGWATLDLRRGWLMPCWDMAGHEYSAHKSARTLRVYMLAGGRKCVPRGVVLPVKFAGG